jgi:transcriptional regulator MraZ
LAFLGQYEHTLDAKKRLTVPAKFRAALSDGVILARSLDPCVCIYTPSGWERFSSDWLRPRDPFDEEARRVQRYFHSGSFDTALDAAGRIMLPPTLIEHAGIAKDVVVIGCDGWIEVWDRDRWLSYKSDSDATIGESAQRLARSAPVRP